MEQDHVTEPTADPAETRPRGLQVVWQLSYDRLIAVLVIIGAIALGAKLF